MTLRNRMLMCPIGDSLANDEGTVSERQLSYFEARARGGAALLLVGSVAVSYPAGSYSARQVSASDERFVDGLRQLADRVHHHGARIATQLVHDGAVSLHDIAEGRPLLGVLDDDEVPVLAVTRGRRLLRELEALFEHLALDRTREVEPLANRPRRGEQLVRS